MLGSYMLDLKFCNAHTIMPNHAICHQILPIPYQPYHATARAPAPRDPVPWGETDPKSMSRMVIEQHIPSETALMRNKSHMPWNQSNREGAYGMLWYGFARDTPLFIKVFR